MFCPNPKCDHRKRTKKPAEFMEGVKTCSDCGSTLSKTVPHFKTAHKLETHENWTCPQCGSINREELPLCSCGYDVNRLHVDRQADKVAWPAETTVSSPREKTSNKQKLLSAYKTIAISLLLITIIHFLHWVREFKAAKINGHEHVPIPYSFEIPMMLWNLAPYLLMIVYLWFQQRLLKKGAITVIDTSLVVTASATGVFLFFYIDIVNLDGLGYAFGHLFMPIIQLIVSVILVAIFA